MVILLVVPLTISGIFSYQHTAIIERAIIEKSELEALGSRYQNIFAYFESLLDQLVEQDEFQFETINVTAHGDTDISRMPAANQPNLTYYYEQTLTELADDDDYVLNLYIGTSDGALYLDSIPDADLTNYDPRTRDWYIQSTEANGDTIWTSPYIDAASGEPVITIAKAIQDHQGQVIGAIGLDFDMAQLVRLVRMDTLKETIIITVISVVAGLIIVFFFIRSLLFNLKTINHEMERIAAGDLSGEPLKMRGKNEFYTLANSVDKMKQQLAQVIDGIKVASNKVTEQSVLLTESAYQVKEGSEYISTTMEQLTVGSETQANSSTELATAMERYRGQVEAATIHSKDVVEQSEHVAQLSQQGAKQINLSTNQMQQIHQLVHNAYQKVKGLDQKSQEIGQIVTVIREIAEQTNLLALNAAIEAARAGEEGRGFAVVADEVRKLADQVNESIAEISTIIIDIQTESTEVSQALETGYDQVDQGTKQIEQTGVNFKNIDDSLTDMVDKIQHILTDLTKIQAETQQMNQGVDEIASVSQEAAAAIEQAAASTEETNSSMEEVSKSAKELSDLATSLEQAVKKFTI